MNTIRIRLGHEYLDVTLAYLNRKDAESEEAQGHAKSLCDVDGTDVPDHGGTVEGRIGAEIWFAFEHAPGRTSAGAIRPAGGPWYPTAPTEP
jgi:hypothetical protein